LLHTRRESKGETRIALFLGLFAGPLAFVVCEQLVHLVLSQKLAPLFSLVTYCLTFLPVALTGVALGSIAMRIGGQDGGLRAPLGLVVILALLAVGRLLLTSSDGGDSKLIAFAVGSSLLLIAGCRWMERHRLGSLRRWLFAGLVWGIFLAWVLIAPEESTYATDSIRYLFHFAFLTSLCAIAFVNRIQTNAPAWVEPLGLGVLLALVAGIQTIGIHGRCEFPAPRETTAAPQAAPNIVFIVLDTVRRDHLSVYGYRRKTTPFLEELAQTSRVYTDALAVSPWTLPSHSSMFTGIYPRSHGAHHPESRPSEPIERLPGLLSEERTLAEILHDHGYQTGAASANPWVGPEYGMKQGFDFFCGQRNPTFLTPSPLVKLHSFMVRWIRGSLPIALAPQFAAEPRQAAQVIDQGLAWIDSLGEAEPFFLFLNLMDAHDPVLPPPRLNDRFPGFLPELHGVRYATLSRRLESENRTLSDTERQHLASQYDASLVYLDEQLARFKAELDKRGLFESLLLIVTSDHGEALGEHGLLGHGRELYSELINIPLIIRYPGGLRAGVEAAPFENRRLFDLVPAAAGIPARAENTPWAAASETFPTWTDKPGMQRVRRAFRFGEFKFISSSDGKDELYNVVVDPAEDHNLASGAKEPLGTGRELAGAFLARTPRAERDLDAENLTLDPSHRARLRELGYTE
jgi:arylsulfatase A-like enzyme